VYGILCAQMTLTTLVCASVIYDSTVSDFVFAHPSVQLLSLILPLIGSRTHTAHAHCAAVG
jgi:hypothetical protein